MLSSDMTSTTSMTSLAAAVELHDGLIFEYDLVNGEQTVTGNKPGRQMVKILSVGNGKVRYAFLASDYWLEAGAAYPVEEYERFLVSRAARVTYYRTAAEIAQCPVPKPVDADAKPVKSLQVLCLEVLTAGRKLTAEVAAAIGKPVAAANSALSALARANRVKAEPTNGGITWSILS